MKRASYKKDFQSWKGIMALKLLCCNIVAGRFDWKKYCTPQSYCGQEICVVPLHCSYGQIGYTVHFPYSDIPGVGSDAVRVMSIHKSKGLEFPVVIMAGLNKEASI